MDLNKYRKHHLFKNLYPGASLRSFHVAVERFEKIVLATHFGWWIQKSITCFCLQFISRHIQEVGCDSWSSKNGHHLLFGCMFGGGSNSTYHNTRPIGPSSSSSHLPHFLDLGGIPLSAHMNDSNYQRLCKLIPHVARGCLELVIDNFFLKNYEFL